MRFVDVLGLWPHQGEGVPKAHRADRLDLSLNFHSGGLRVGTERFFSWPRAIFRDPNKGVQSTVENAAPVDAEKPDGQGVRVGERTRRARRKAAPSLFDNCQMVPVSSFTVRCQKCGVRSSYEIRQAENGKGRELVCVEVLIGWLANPMAEGCKENPNQCASRAFDGLGFRSIATLAGETYLVVGKPRTVAPERASAESGDLFANGYHSDDICGD